MVAIMVTPHSGETDSLQVVATGRKYVNYKYTPFLASYMTKSLGTRLKLICDGPELKTLCHYYFHINVIIQQNVLIYYYSGLDAHDCECWDGEHLGMSMNKAVVDSCLNCQVTHTILIVASILVKNEHSFIESPLL